MNSIKLVPIQHSSSSDAATSAPAAAKKELSKDDIKAQKAARRVALKAEREQQQAEIEALVAAKK